MHVLTTALAPSPPQVQRAWSTRGTPGSPFSARHMRLRARMDAYLRDYVHDWSVHRLGWPLMAADGLPIDLG